MRSYEYESKSFQSFSMLHTALNKVQDLSFITTASRVAVFHTKTASTGTFHNSYSAEISKKRTTVLKAPNI
jgi:hypothetical protein